MNIMRFRPAFFCFSFLILALSLFSLYFWRFQPSIDFSGGTVYEIQFSRVVDQAVITTIFTRLKINLISQSFTTANLLTLKFEPIDQTQKLQLTDSLKALDPQLTELRFVTLGPLLGQELLSKTVAAIILASIVLLVFIGRRFNDLSFGLAAVLAMFHDSLILTGSFSLLGHFFGAELDSLFVTALLTTLSASVHDTVVTFDRIRELRRKNPRLEWVNLAKIGRAHV